MAEIYSKAHEIPFSPFPRSPWYQQRPAPPVSVPSGEFPQGEMVRSQGEEPVCLKGLLLVLNAILTDKSELIRAGNSSGCIHLFQVVAHSLPRDLFSLYQRAVLFSLSSFLTPKPWSVSSFQKETAFKERILHPSARGCHGSPTLGQGCSEGC